MSKYLCKKCGREITPNMKFCKYCGTHLQVVKSLCPTCHREYDESANFCPTCASRCEKKQVFEANVIEEVVKPQPVEVVKPVTNTVSIPTIKASAFTVVEEALNKDSIRIFFKVYGIFNTCVVGLTFLVLLFFPITDPNDVNERLKYQTFFIYFVIMIKNIITNFSNGGFTLTLLINLICIFIVLASVIIFLSLEFAQSLKLVDGGYEKIFSNTFTQNLRCINFKICTVICLFAFMKPFLIFSYKYGNINPIIVMMPAILSSIVYVLVGMIIRHKMLEKSEPRVQLPRPLLAHRIMHIVCSLMIATCFVIYAIVVSKAKIDLLRITWVEDNTDLYSFLVYYIFGGFVYSLPQLLYYFVCFVSILAAYYLLFIPTIQLFFGISRICGFSRQNEIQNELYNNAGMGSKFAFMCVLLSIVCYAYSTTKLLKIINIKLFIVLGAIFILLLGLTIAINVIEKKAKKALYGTVFMNV